MNAIPVIAIFDIGKTNKKLLLFNESYQLVKEISIQFSEIEDEDGFVCDSIEAITNWILQSVQELHNNKEFAIKAFNFSAYGASFVYLDDQLKVIAPLYNYLKPLSESTMNAFYECHGERNLLSLQTASPVLGNLNSGLQLYRIKKELPNLFSTIKFALHLPQYLSFLLSGQLTSDLTSIGCHTMLWDFEHNCYHEWVLKEGINQKLTPIVASNSIIATLNNNITVGAGLHDSSSALIPYLITFREPFVLISTGTWCISLNPFNNEPIKQSELEQDCLCYMTYQGKPVKASRLFAGHDHEAQIKILAIHYNKAIDYFKDVKYDPFFVYDANNSILNYTTYEEAYHHLIHGIVKAQVISTDLVLNGPIVKKIFVDGGFASNSIYMHLIAKAYPLIEVYAASIPQASSLGAALCIHDAWNNNTLPSNLISLQFYSTAQ